MFDILPSTQTHTYCSSQSLKELYPVELILLSTNHQQKTHRLKTTPTTIFDEDTCTPPQPYPQSPLQPLQTLKIQSTQSVPLQTTLNHFVSKHVSLHSFNSFTEGIIKGLDLCKQGFQETHMKHLRSKTVLLKQPSDEKKKFLMLDLDETLGHSEEGGQEQASLILGFNFRPGVEGFLKRMSQHFHIYIFTASTLDYAQPIVEFLNKNETVIHGILTRKHCLRTKEGLFIKDLRIIENRDLSSIILIDNLVHSFGFQLDNGIPILEYRDDGEDKQLSHVEGLLMRAKEFPDVRTFFSQYFGLRERAQSSVFIKTV